MNATHTPIGEYSPTYADMKFQLEKRELELESATRTCISAGETVARMRRERDALVAALRELEREVSAKHAHDLHANHPDFLLLKLRIEDARAALAKAGAA